MEVKNTVMEKINNESLNDFYELLGEKAVLVKDDEKKNIVKDDLNNVNLDDLYEMLGGKALFGKDEEYLKKQINILENKERNEEETKQLFKYRNELGLSNEGKTKGKMCWDYV